MGKALYRKYRPKTLSEVIGEPQVTDTLDKAIKNGKIAHAYLFIGPRGCGKTSTARIFAHEINNFKYELEDDYVDIIEIDAASNTSVENIRELREKASIAPTKGKYKVYIIDEIHMLSKSAFNALLKILEEPPKHVIFIMATTDAYKVPITITSRAQVFTFKLADEKTMSNHISTICEKESIEIDQDAIGLIAKRGGGSFRDTISLLDQLSTMSEGKITKNFINESLGLPEEELINKILSAYVSADISGVTNTLKTLLNNNIGPELIAEALLDNIIKNPSVEYLPLLEKLPLVQNPFPEAKLLSALLLQAKPQIVAAPTQPIITNKILNPTLKSSEKEVQPDKQPTRQPVEQLSVQPIAQPAIVPPNNSNLTIESILASIKEQNDAIFSQLTKSILQINNQTLHIYPSKNIIKTIISRDNNKAIIIRSAGGLKVEIHNVDENPTSLTIKKDQKFAAISDIMGDIQEVKNEGGIPF